MSDCIKPSKEEILKFLKETYGDSWAKESMIPLGYKIWEKKFCKKKTYAGQVAGGSDREYVKKSIDEINDRELVEVVGIVIDRDFFKYLGCPVCFKSVKSGCEHLRNGQEPVELAITKIVVSDGTGDLNVTTLLKEGDEDPFEEIETGFVVKLQGYSRVVGGEKRMYVNNVEIVQRVDNVKEEAVVNDVSVKKDNILRIDDINNPNVQNFLRYLMNSGGMKKEIADMMMERKGITWDDIRPYVDINDGIVTVKEGVI